MRLGRYCSYCERSIPIGLAVEHVLPKLKNPDYLKDWDNFLLGCSNCNGVKGDDYDNPQGGKEEIRRENFIWPDRDNPLCALQYLEGGIIEVLPDLESQLKKKAQALLNLVGLQRRPGGQEPTPRDRRWLDREQIYAVASDFREHLRKNDSAELRSLILDAAVHQGFFSVWLTLFKDDPLFCRQLISRMPGTATDCFDENGLPINRPGGFC